MRVCVILVLAASLRLSAQDPGQPEKWNLHVQATSIGQYHGGLNSPYAGAFSLQGHPEAEASLTSTLFFGFRLARNTQFYFDPELAGGRGFSGTNGIANFPNGEMPRVATATPKPYLARLYVTQDFGFGDARESFSSDENQLAGSRTMTRYAVTIGRFTVTDFFDNNRYTHDPRTQFMGWAIMYNGAWDYPADTRGYTWGWVHEFLGDLSKQYRL
jgi:high affinity Mn2+ porin